MDTNVLIYAPDFEALRLHQTARLSFWDAMIVVSAHRLECQVIWSEDLNPGQSIRGLAISNPFATNPGR